MLVQELHGVVEHAPDWEAQAICLADLYEQVEASTNSAERRELLAVLWHLGLKLEHGLGRTEASSKVVKRICTAAWREMCPSPEVFSTFLVEVQGVLPPKVRRLYWRAAQRGLENPHYRGDRPADERKLREALLALDLGAGGLALQQYFPMPC